MAYWHDIVKSYDDPESKNPGKRDDGTYSQFSVVILLIYLFFDSDYAYRIAKYFENLSNPEFGRARSSVLRHTGRIGTVLNKMEEDGLVLSKMEGPRKYFTINPGIIQSPVRDAAYVKPDGSKFEIPLGMIDQFLVWQQENLKKFNAKDLFFKTVQFYGSVDYITFMTFLKREANFHDSIIFGFPLSSCPTKEIYIMNPNFNLVTESIDFSKSWYAKISEQNKLRLGFTGKSLGFLSGLISEYIDELEELASDNSDLDKEHGLSVQEFKPKATKVERK